MPQSSDFVRSTMTEGRRTPFSDPAELASAGFVGWRTVAELRNRIDLIPAVPGVYLVIFEGNRPTVLATSGGGWFKGRDPSVPVATLEARLNLPTRVLYIGKGDNLRRRLDQLFRFAQGEPIGHWGGRYLWQLEAADQFVIAWRPAEGPLAAEAELLQGFVVEFGSLPFANLRF